MVIEVNIGRMVTGMEGTQETDMGDIQKEIGVIEQTTRLVVLNVDPKITGREIVIRERKTIKEGTCD